MKWLAYARKSLTALVGGSIGWAYIVVPTGHVTAMDWLALATVGATALGVYNGANGGRPVKASPPPAAASSLPSYPVTASSSGYGANGGNPAVPAPEPAPAAVPAA